MALNASMEEFEALLNESFEMDTPDEGSVVTGKVIAVEAGQAIIDVGYKMEGRVELKEFANPGARKHRAPIGFDRRRLAPFSADWCRSRASIPWSQYFRDRIKW